MDDHTQTDVVSTTDSPLDRILEEVAQEISPSPDEQDHLEEVTNQLINQIQTAVQSQTPFNTKEINITQVGSTARETFLTGDSDIDLFVQFPQDASRDRLETAGLDIGKHALPNPTQDYAEHPYITGMFHDFEVDIVPCFNIDDPSELRSSVDRTPFHTRYLKAALTESLRRDVRIAKRFLKAHSVYGANATTQGFSGFVTELLVLRYGGFKKLLSAVVEWDSVEVIDIENHASSTFSSPIVVIDPVDPTRNAAAAISETSKSHLIIAARQFLASPSTQAFDSSEPRPIEPKYVSHYFEHRGTYPVSLEIEIPDLLDEHLFPQLEKSWSGISSLLDRYDFDIIRSDILVAEDRSTAAFLFELGQQKLPRIRRKKGPEVTRREASDGFISACEHSDLSTGPFVEGNRLVVERERDYRFPEKLLMSSPILNVEHGARLKNAFTPETTIVSGAENVAQLATKDGYSRQFRAYKERSV